MGDGRTVTYGALAHGSGRRARALRDAGIGPGDVVLVAHGVSPALYETLLALFRLGAVAMFPEPAAGLRGLRDAIALARPVGLLASRTVLLLRPFLPALRGLRRLPTQPGPSAADAATPGDDPLLDTPPEAPALLTFTSGTTGRPKGIKRSVACLLRQHEMLEQIRATQPDDIDLISLPVFILSNLAAGATSVVPAGRLRRPASLNGHRLRRQIRTHRVNRIVAPPAVCERIVRADGGPALDRITAVFTGGGPVFPNLLRAMHDAMPGAALHLVYGSTEAEPIAHVRFDEITDADFAAMAAGGGLLAGAPVPQATLRVEADELWVSGPHVNQGYLDPSDDTATKVWEGDTCWHRTGDAAYIDGAGRMWLLGRIAAAANGLFPFAVEAAARTWPGVRQAALLVQGGTCVLAVAGSDLDVVDLRRRTRALGHIELAVLPSVPMDRRHNSKVDYPRLRALIERQR